MTVGELKQILDEYPDDIAIALQDGEWDLKEPIFVYEQAVTEKYNLWFEQDERVVVIT